MADWSTLRLRLQDRVEQKPFWDDTEALMAFNEALCLWNILTGMWRRTSTFAAVGGQYEYVLPSNLLYRTRLLYNARPLTSSSREEFNLLRARWRTETTATGGDVPTRPIAFAPISLQLIYIWPATAITTGTFTVEGISATPQLVEDGDILDATDDLLEDVLGLALHILTFKKGGQAFSESMSLFKAFLESAAELNGVIKTSTVYRRVMGLDRRDMKMLKGPSQPQPADLAGAL